MKVGLTLLLMLAVASPAIADEPAVDYSRDIKPILKERCFACHGALQQKAGLRLDTGALMRRGGDGGPAVVAGKVDSSLLVNRISSQEVEQRMPAEGKPLSVDQIAKIKAWIEQGAASPENEQSEQDPREHWAFKKPARPSVPTINNQKTKIENDLDSFVLAKLEAAGITPRPQAEKHVLLRRVYLDLIGLPPTRDELQAFLADESPTAYEAVVDRLLRDPRHGERWARHWMDLWRYADWHGRRHVPDVWNSAPQIWRWRDWIVRSLNADHGYDRMIREMLAADEVCPEDDDATVATGYLIRNWYALNPNDWMRNTVEHTGKAFLGLTFNCAHCHDHKYDPITQDDYFRLRAFFEPIYVRQDRVPGEADPGPFQDYDYGKLRKIQRLGAVRIFDKTADAPTWFYTGGDERNRVKERGSMSAGVPAFLQIHQHDVPASGQVRGDSPTDTSSAGTSDHSLARRASSGTTIAPINLPTHAYYPALRPAIIETMLNDARAAIATAEAELVAASMIAEQRSTRLAAAAAKLLAARAELKSLEARIAADRAKFGESPNSDVASLAREASRLERIAAMRKVEADVLAQENALVVAEAKPMTDMNRAKEVDTATKALAAAKPVLEKALVAANDTASETYTPLGPTYPKTSTGRRKALAEWMTNRDNPLTARVAVNHIWSHHFHQPLVTSVTDFGRNGAKPTHPELLDWLAVEFMDSGWSMKHLHRLIVTSAAYRRRSGELLVVSGEQSSVAANSPLATNNSPLSIDPENKLLWRMNAGRMEAEVVRDSVLFVAGKLDPKLGGQELENTEALTTFRRSLYYSVFPEQGGMSPLGELFDAPNPLDCYRRTTSIIPQQALALTNSELIHKLSTDIAASIPEATADRFIIAAFERILSRQPTATEIATCSDFLTNPTDARSRESLVRAILNHNDFVTIR